MQKILLLLFFIATVSGAAAQSMDIFEKTHDISRKSRKGYLGAVESDKTKNTISLTFVLKPTRKTIPFEIYTFDKDLNLINTVKEEDEVEKLRTKWKWFKYKGETYETKSFYANANLKFDLVLRNKTVTYKWSWLRGGYARKVKTGDKVKLKDEDGAKYEYGGGFYDNDDEGNILVPVFTKGTNRNSAHILKIEGTDATSIKTIETAHFTLGNNWIPVLSKPVEGELTPDNTTGKPDWALLFAPSHDSKDKPQLYKYLRVNSDGKIMEQSDFEAANAPWAILGAIQKNGSTYFYGPSIDKDKPSFKILGNLVPTSTDETKEKAMSGGNPFGMLKKLVKGEDVLTVSQDEIDERLAEIKFPFMQLAKITNGKLEYMQAPKVKDFNDKAVKPEGQKKASEFDAKGFVTSAATVNHNNELIISGQDIDFKKNQGRIYKDVFLLQFGADGVLKHYYGVKLEQKRSSWSKKDLDPDMIPASSILIPSEDKKKLYWMIGECKNIDTDTDIDTDYNYFAGTSTTTITTVQNGLFTVLYGSLDLENGAASEFKVLGDDEKRNFYLFPENNAIKLNQYQIFISETTKGDKILLSRFDVSK